MSLSSRCSRSSRPVTSTNRNMASAEQLCGPSLEPGAGPGHALPGSVEALFPAGPGDEDPELARLTERVRGWLSQYEPLLLWLQRLLVWERPVYSVSAAVTLNTLFWLISSTSLRPLFLLSVSLLGLMLLERWKHKLPLCNVQQAETPPKPRGTELEPRLLSVPELSLHLADSYRTCCLYLQETLLYKRHNHGKFCAVMCSGCLALAAVGHYVPGVMISYIIVLSVLLWPLVVYHELIQRMYTGLEPIFMKLEYSMKGETDRRSHDKRKVKKELEGEPRAETESESEEEEELCCFAPTVDVKTTALAMAITDSELSDEEASILESGGFSVSRATTPQLTDVSEDLDQQSVFSDPEESYLRDLPEFPSVERWSPYVDPPDPAALPPRGPQASPAQPRAPSEVELLSPTSLLFQHLASPLHFVNTHFNGHAHTQPQIQVQTGVQPQIQTEAESEPMAEAESESEPMAEAESESGPMAEAESGPMAEAAQRSLEALSEEIVSTAISAVVHNTLFALLRSSEDSEEPTLAEFLPETLDTPPNAEEEEEEQAEAGDDAFVPSEYEDFELLDQSELDQAEEELSADTTHRRS